MGAPSTMPSCHRIFRVRDQGLFPQKVQPEGLRGQSRAGPVAPAQTPAQPALAMGDGGETHGPAGEAESQVSPIQPGAPAGTPPVGC